MGYMVLIVYPNGKQFTIMECGDVHEAELEQCKICTKFIATSTDSKDSCTTNCGHAFH